MQGRGAGKVQSPSSKKMISPNKEKELSPNSRRLIGFKPKNMSNLKSVSPNSKRSGSPLVSTRNHFKLYTVGLCNTRIMLSIMSWVIPLRKLSRL